MSKAEDLIKNIKYDLERTFLANGLILPASIVCRYDQERTIKKQFTVFPVDGTNIDTVDLGYGVMKLKVLPLERSEITHTRAIR
jgi:hypothetical protein